MVLSVMKMAKAAPDCGSSDRVLCLALPLEQSVNDCFDACNQASSILRVCVQSADRFLMITDPFGLDCYRLRKKCAPFSANGFAPWKGLR